MESLFIPLKLSLVARGFDEAYSFHRIPSVPGLSGHVKMFLHVVLHVMSHGDSY